MCTLCRRIPTVARSPFWPPLFPRVLAGVWAASFCPDATLGRPCFCPSRRMFPTSTTHASPNVPSVPGLPVTDRPDDASSIDLASYRQRCDPSPQWPRVGHCCSVRVCCVQHASLSLLLRHPPEDGWQRRDTRAHLRHGMAKRLSRPGINLKRMDKRRDHQTCSLQRKTWQQPNKRRATVKPPSRSRQRHPCQKRWTVLKSTSRQRQEQNRV